MQLHFVKDTATITLITSFWLSRSNILPFKSLVHIEPVTDINLKWSVKIHPLNALKCSACLWLLNSDVLLCILTVVWKIKKVYYLLRMYFEKVSSNKGIMKKKWF